MSRRCHNLCIKVDFKYEYKYLLKFYSHFSIDLYYNILLSMLCCVANCKPNDVDITFVRYAHSDGVCCVRHYYEKFVLIL